MASVEADRLTRLHARRIAGLDRLIVRRVQMVARGADIADIDRWWRREGGRKLVGLVAKGFAAAADISARHLVAHSAAEGAVLQVERPSQQVERQATSLWVTGPVAFKTAVAAGAAPDVALRSMRARLSGSASRLVLAGDRETFMGTFAVSDAMAGWRRVARGDACAFCLMLVSRGAVYSKHSVEFQAHDHCRCGVEALYAREDDPPRVVELREKWSASTAGVPVRDRLAAFRRAVDAA